MVSTTELQTALSDALDGDVRTDPYTRHLYSSDASMYAIEPLAVAFPRHADDVAAIVATAAELGVPVLPRGAGTSLAGQTVGRAVIADFSRHLSKIIAIDPEARTARVQPGVVQDRLNRAAAPHGLMFGPDTSTSNRATIGGMIGNNSAGSHSVRYGSTIDHIEALDVVLSDATRLHLAPVPLAGLPAHPGLAGRLYRRLPEILKAHTAPPPYWRHSGGYRLDRALTPSHLDLAKLIVGSEGTLALVTEATVTLVPRPRAKAIAVGHFASTPAAVAATGDALAQNPASVELIDRTILDLSRARIEYAGLADILHGSPQALLFVEFFGEDETEVAAQLEALAKRWQGNGHGYHTLRAVTPEQQAAVLKVRKAGLGLLMAASTGTRRPLAFVEDTAVPPEKLEAYVRDFAQILDDHDLKAGFYGHCSVGCLHIRPFVDLRRPEQIATMRKVAGEIADLARSYGGVNSSEHGDGLARSEFNRRILGTDLYEAMREVKHLFDPDGRLNPGKIVDAPPMTENLRDPNLPEPAALSTQLTFTPDMRGAADRCMNIGACRKDDTGVMCPSYMATREEQHSTRGRANALVKALSSPNPHAALGDRELHEALDLCLECKACKSECPLSVDMATLKSEFLHHYHTVHGTPLRSRVFGSIRTLNRLGSALAPFSNRPAQATSRLLGITPHRPLPRFRRDSLPRWFKKRPTSQAPFPNGDVILLADSFTTFTEPQIGRAAVELLERAGWRVHLSPSSLCCGRANLSKGLIPQAKAQAAKLLNHLAQTEAPIVGIEPSCLLTLRDDYPTLVPTRQAKSVAARTHLIQELLNQTPLPIPANHPLTGRRIVLHAHCHEKAIAGTAATRALLADIPGTELHELDAGCCGMAGSFGYEAEHYDLSMQIGSLRLFPALNDEPRETIVAATGVSCRQQIAHGTKRTALHPIELLRQALP